MLREYRGTTRGRGARTGTTQASSHDASRAVHEFKGWYGYASLLIAAGWVSPWLLPLLKAVQIPRKTFGGPPSGEEFARPAHFIDIILVALQPCRKHSPDNLG